jgi:hypothetical protein
MGSCTKDNGPILIQKNMPKTLTNIVETKAVGSAEREREAGAGAGAGSAYFQKSPGAGAFRERFLYNT